MKEVERGFWPDFPFKPGGPSTPEDLIKPEGDPIPLLETI